MTGYILFENMSAVPLKEFRRTLLWAKGWIKIPYLLLSPSSHFGEKSLHSRSVPYWNFRPMAYQGLALRFIGEI